ncbi:hypothetical protein HMPREF1326_00564 [Akkermansia sp. KLE1605]|nr:hypothetical protein HMPREF1326_00564 [Akkermansia sp. KLE1605]
MNYSIALSGYDYLLFFEFQCYYCLLFQMPGELLGVKKDFLRLSMLGSLSFQAERPVAG